MPRGRWQGTGSGTGTGGPAPAPPSTPSRAVGAGTGTVQTRAEQATGLVAYTFGFANLAASQNALQATRDIGGTRSQVGVRMPYAGSIVGIAYESNATKTAGVATFVVYLAAEQSDASADWTANNTGDTITFPAGQFPFDAQEIVDVRATTDGAFLPTTADIDVQVYVSFAS